MPDKPDTKKTFKNVECFGGGRAEPSCCPGCSVWALMGKGRFGSDSTGTRTAVRAFPSTHPLPQARPSVPPRHCSPCWLSCFYSNHSQAERFQWFITACRREFRLLSFASTAVHSQRSHTSSSSHLAPGAPPADVGTEPKSQSPQRPLRPVLGQLVLHTVHPFTLRLTSMACPFLGWVLARAKMQRSQSLL